ncbi:MAG: hypothetical protein H7222_09505 [Methylotenera sp.]|nr:hypothetical protein [Oligoflexia bacterium]
MKSRPEWARKLEKRLGPVLKAASSAALQRKTDHHFSFLRKALPFVSELKLKPHPLALQGQPLDSVLLTLSPLFRESREVYLRQGCEFEPALITSPRSLSSVSLVKAKIQYSPIAEELMWAATDPNQKNDPSHLMMLITFTTSLYHEQNHRILWNLLPPPPLGDPEALRRYLNFAESLVITLDMALGDELGPALASLFYLTGVTYDPGTVAKRDLMKTQKKNSPSAAKRLYRNYLQAALHSTFLHLELYNADNVEAAIQKLFPTLGDFALRATRRSANLDSMFINLTNPDWQEMHGKTVVKALQKQSPQPLVISENPMENHFQYLFAEKAFDLLGL